jgi:hypothetical protein
MVILQNISKRMVVLSLTGLHMREGQGAHSYKPIKIGVVDALADGTLLARFKTKFVPETVTLPAGERVVNLPNAVLECEDVKGALKRKEIRIAQQTPDEAPEEKADPAIEPTADHDEIHDVKKT